MVTVKIDSGVLSQIDKSLKLSVCILNDMSLSNKHNVEFIKDTLILVDKMMNDVIHEEIYGDINNKKEDIFAKLKKLILEDETDCELEGTFLKYTKVKKFLFDLIDNLSYNKKDKVEEKEIIDEEIDSVLKCKLEEKMIGLIGRHINGVKASKIYSLFEIYISMGYKSCKFMIMFKDKIKTAILKIVMNNAIGGEADGTIALDKLNSILIEFVNEDCDDYANKKDISGIDFGRDVYK